MGKLVSVLLALSLLLGSLPVSARAAGNNSLDPAVFLNPDGTLNVSENFSGSFDLRGWDVRLDPGKGAVFSPLLATTGQWSSLGGAGTGLNGSVRDVEFSGGVLYAGGQFTDAGGDVDADYIAQFSGGVWSSLGGAGTGLNNYVEDIEFNGGVLYAGGGFTNAGDADGDYVAKFSGGVWSSLGGPGTGLPDYIYDIEFDGGVLYTGGNFINAGGDADADYIAKFSSGVWSSLGGGGTGLNNYVIDVEINGGVVYASGNFTDAGSDANADRVAQFTGGVWSALGGVPTLMTAQTYNIEFSGGVLYAGGDFANAGGDANADFISKFSGGVWSSVGGAGTGLNGTVYEIEFNNGTLYAAGNFNNAGGDADADRLARFSSGAWSSLGGVGTGLNGFVFEINSDGDVLYAGGVFTDAGGDANADRIAQFGLPEESSGSSGGEQQGSKEIAASGTTTFTFQRAYISVPASAVPPGETNCKIVVADKGDSGDYGFSLDDVVYDVKIVCDSGPVTLLFDHITVCIRPKDGVVSNKQIFHKHTGASSFAPLAGGTGPSGYVCGSTQVLSLFTLGQLVLPATGFAPGVVTDLGGRPASANYVEAEGLMLEIPQLDLLAQIWGVPQTENGWDVSWLGPNAGYLYGTAFPTWAGNSVLTAHVWNADNTPGPFYHLKDLQYGERFYIHTNGQTYVYEVRSNKLVSESNLSVMKDSDYSLMTLITCESYNEGSGEYLYRRAVQAVLVDVY